MGEDVAEKVSDEFSFLFRREISFGGGEGGGGVCGRWGGGFEKGRGRWRHLVIVVGVKLVLEFWELYKRFLVGL